MINSNDEVKVLSISSKQTSSRVKWKYYSFSSDLIHRSISKANYKKLKLSGIPCESPEYLRH